MKTLLVKFICLFILVISTTSCFEIVEELTLHSDGSGAISLTFNASQSKTKLASVMLLDSVQGYKVPSKQDITNHVKDLVNQLKAANGISNVTYTIDFDTYIVTLGCNFRKVDNLNNFAQQLWDKQKIKGKMHTYGFNAATKLFTRQFNFSDKMKESFNSLQKEDKQVLDQANYTVIYRFDDQVQSYSNTHSKLSKSKKAMMMKLPIIDIINGKASPKNNIQLTN